MRVLGDGSAPGPRTAPAGRGGARGTAGWPGFYRRSAERASRLAGLVIFPPDRSRSEGKSNGQCYNTELSAIPRIRLNNPSGKNASRQFLKYRRGVHKTPRLAWENQVFGFCLQMVIFLTALCAVNHGIVKGEALDCGAWGRKGPDVPPPTNGGFISDESKLFSRLHPPHEGKRA